MLCEIRSPINPLCPTQGFINRTVTLTSAGVIVYVDTGNDIPDLLLTRQADQPNKPWGIPAGHVETSDLSLEDTAKREVREETQLEIEVGDPFAVWYHEFPKESRNFGKVVYLVGFKCKYISCLLYTSPSPRD